MAQSLDLTQGVSSFSAAGVPVILKETEGRGLLSDEIVAIHLTASGGVALTEKAGVLQVLTQVMSKGTYSFSKEEIDRILIRTGASLSISPGSDQLSISIKCLRPQLSEILPMVSEMMRVPLLAQTEIDLAKSQLMNDLRGELDSPDSRLRLLAHRTFFREHPYFNRPSGYLDSVPEITRDDLSSVLFRAFTKENLTAVVVGPLTKKEVTEHFERSFASLPKGRRVQPVTQRPSNPTDQVFFEAFEAPTSFFLARFNAPGIESDDYPALQMGLNILDNRLFDELRTKRALGYSVSAGMGNSRINIGSLYIMSNQIEEALEAALAEVRKLQIAPVSQELLDRQANKFLTGWYRARETRTGQSRVLALYESLGLGWEASNNFIRRLQQVTPEQVQAAMNKHFTDLTVTIVGSEKPKVSESLARYGYLSLSPQAAE